jgi:hypothetical protein
LSSHGLEVALHPVDSNRNAVDQQNDFGCLGSNGRKHIWDNVSKFKWRES